MSFFEEVITPQRFLHQYTYPQLQTVEEPVLDWTGVMWCGKNRRGLNAPNAVDLWKIWQKDVQKASQRAGVVSPEVMRYFQETKHLSRPPKKGEVKFNFTWSFSQLNQFETCSFQWAAERYYQTTGRQETEATLWGSRVHKQLEDYINTCGETELPEMGAKYAKALVAAKSKGVEVICELQMAVDRQLAPVDFASGWGRGVADVVIVNNGIAKIWDWKTGKRKFDLTQLLIFCAFLSVHRPDIEEFQAEFIWLKDDIKEGMTVPATREHLKQVWDDILDRVARMEKAVEEEVFAKNQSGLCRNWCGVTECPNCGRGR